MWGYSMIPHECHPVSLHRSDSIIIPCGFFGPVDDEDSRVVMFEGDGG
jgi:hypothetical protein